VGSAGQTSGVANAGTAGGDWVMVETASLSTDTPLAGVSSLRAQMIFDSAGAELVLPSALVLPVGQAWTLEGRYRIDNAGGSVFSYANVTIAADVGSSRLLGFVAFFTDAAAATPDFTILNGTAGVQPTITAAVGFATDRHICLSMDDTGQLRFFLDGTSVYSAARGWSLFPMSVSRVFASALSDEEVGFARFDNIRLRTGFAYTANFTPDTSI
jgi:hypothetical protein